MEQIDFFSNNKPGKHIENFGAIVTGFFIDNIKSKKYGDRTQLSIECVETFPLTININPNSWVKNDKGTPMRPPEDSTIYAFLLSLFKLGIKTAIDFSTEEIEMTPSLVGQYVEFVVEYVPMVTRLTGSAKRAQANTTPDNYAVWKVAKVSPANEAPVRATKENEAVNFFVGNSPNAFEPVTLAPTTPAVQLTPEEIAARIQAQLDIE